MEYSLRWWNLILLLLSLEDAVLDEVLLTEIKLCVKCIGFKFLIYLGFFFSEAVRQDGSSGSKAPFLLLSN